MTTVGKEKVTWMKLKTEDLNSSKNWNKVKTALCSISQVRDQTFDEKSNTVTIKVVCCSPEKVMDRLCSKGRGAIKLIETIDPPKPSGEKPKAAEKPKEAEKPKAAPAPAPAPAPAATSSQPVMWTPAAYQPVVVHNGSNYDPTQQQVGYPVYDSWGGGLPPQRPYYDHDGRSDYYSEGEGCSIM